MMTDKELVKVIQSKGVIQYRSLGFTAWVNKVDPGWNTHSYEYRVKPTRFEMAGSQVKIWNDNFVSYHIREPAMFMRLYKLMNRARANKKGIRLSAKLYAFEGYIRPTGNIRLGCQKYAWAEVNEFVQKQGWL